MIIDVSKWSGEGEFTQVLIDRIKQIDEIGTIHVEDAPASRSEADYNFISNEIFLTFATMTRREGGRGLRFWSSRTTVEKLMTVPVLETMLSTDPAIGAPDYSDQSMLQYLRTQRIVPPYQTRGYKLVELVRIYEAGGAPTNK